MKKAFLIFGPESGGNHITRFLFVKGNCFGEAGDLIDNKLTIKPQLLDEFLLTGKKTLKEVIGNWKGNIVYGKSIPSSGKYLNLLKLAKKFEDNNYIVNWIIPFRSSYCTLQSKKFRKHIKNPNLLTLNKEYKHIFKAVLNHGGIFYLCPISTLFINPKFIINEINKLFNLHIPLKVKRDIIDADKKWKDTIGG